MNVQPNLRMDKAAFLAWVQGREERYELAEGRVLMMTGGSRAHGQIGCQSFSGFGCALDPDRWMILSDFGIDLGPETVRYPDIVVIRQPTRLGTSPQLPQCSLPRCSRRPRKIRSRRQGCRIPATPEPRRVSRVRAGRTQSVGLGAGLEGLLRRDRRSSPRRMPSSGLQPLASTCRWRTFTLGSRLTDLAWLGLSCNGGPPSSNASRLYCSRLARLRCRSRSLRDRRSRSLTRSHPPSGARAW